MFSPVRCDGIGRRFFDRLKTQLGREPLPTTEPAVDAVDGGPATRLSAPESRFLAEGNMTKCCRKLETT
jgi:hypothetical protein